MADAVENEKFGWRYYNHAMLPACAPHEMPNMEPLYNNTIWSNNNTGGGGYPLFVRWTTDFDCGYETDWWYCIKDTRFDAQLLNGKKRYEITRGQKNFRVERINPIQYRNEIFRISKAAFSVYPARYRPSVTKEQINREINGWHDDIVFGAFSRENLLQGYCHILDYATYASYSSHKANPDCEKLGINAALVAGMLDYYNDRLGERFYICDGERNILHKTAFQNYLEKYFDFRKAYSKLHVAYRPFVGIGVRTLFPFRKLLVRADRVSVVHNINGVLRIEEICRETR